MGASASIPLKVERTMTIAFQQHNEGAQPIDLAERRRHRQKNAKPTHVDAEQVPMLSHTIPDPSARPQSGSPLAGGWFRLGDLLPGIVEEAERAQRAHTHNDREAH